MNAHQLMRYFKYDHLPPHLQEISRPFCALAEGIASGLQDGHQKDKAMQKLLEAKDCAVRAGLRPGFVGRGPDSLPG